MPLNDLVIKRAQPGAKIIKLSDGGGLLIMDHADGAKRWRMAYRFGGVQKTLAIGVYPVIGLREAREAREAARQTLARGQDLSRTKREAKAAKAAKDANTFAAVSTELTDEAAGREVGGHAEKIRMVRELRFSGPRRAGDS